MTVVERRPLVVAGCFGMKSASWDEEWVSRGVESKEVDQGRLHEANHHVSIQRSFFRDPELRRRQVQHFPVSSVSVKYVCE